MLEWFVHDRAVPVHSSLWQDLLFMRQPLQVVLLFEQWLDAALCFGSASAHQKGPQVLPEHSHDKSASRDALSKCERGQHCLTGAAALCYSGSCTRPACLLVLRVRCLQHFRLQGCVWVTLLVNCQTRLLADGSLAVFVTLAEKPGCSQ